MTVFAAALLVGIFLIDLLTPIGYAVWMLYFLPILIASKTVRSLYFYFFPTISTLLITIGLFLPFPSVNPSRKSYAGSLEFLSYGRSHS